MTIETIEIPHAYGAKNYFKVPLKMWRKWSPLSRKIFNDLYSSMHGSPWAFQTPGGKTPMRAWKVTCWNAAWIAAEAANGDAR